MADQATSTNPALDASVDPNVPFPDTGDDLGEPVDKGDATNNNAEEEEEEEEMVEGEDEEDEDEDEDAPLDITNVHYKYTKRRSQFGRQTQFLEDRGRVHCNLKPNKERYHPMFLQKTFVNKAEDTMPPIRNVNTNTARLDYKPVSILHKEGGWPKEVNMEEPESLEKVRKRFQKEESFLQAMPVLTREMETLVKHNNAMGLCDELNKNPFQGKKDSMPFATVVSVYQCPSVLKRPVSRIKFSPGGDRMAVCYCPYEFDTTFRDHSCESFIWDVDNATRPEGFVRAAAQIVDCRFHPKTQTNFCGALFTGQLCTWDVRVGPNPQSITVSEVSHEDVCTNVCWTGQGNEFISTGLDGKIIWWDQRNLSTRLDMAEASDPESGEPIPITVLEYDYAHRNKFLIGTQFGQVMIFEKEKNQVKTTTIKKADKTPSKVPSKTASKQSAPPSLTPSKRMAPSLTPSKRMAPAAEDEDEEEEEEEEETNEAAPPEEAPEEEILEDDEEEEMEDGEVEEDYEPEEEEEVEEEEEEEEEEARNNVPSTMKGFYMAHRGPVRSIQRNPLFPDNFLSCGGYQLRVFSEECPDSSIMWTTPSDTLYSSVQWLRGRPSSIVAGRIDGCLEFFDILLQGSNSIFKTKVSDVQLTDVAPTCCGKRVACGTVNGEIRMVQLCPSLTTFSGPEMDALGNSFLREARREKWIQEQAQLPARRVPGIAPPEPSKESLPKPDPSTNTEIEVDKQFFEMLTDEMKRQGVNAFSDKKEQAAAHRDMLVVGRMEEKKKATEAAKKRSDTELGAQQLMQINEVVMKKANAILTGETDDVDFSELEPAEEDESMKEDEEEDDEEEEEGVEDANGTTEEEGMGIIEEVEELIEVTEDEEDEEI